MKTAFKKHARDEVGHELGLECGIHKDWGVGGQPYTEKRNYMTRTWNPEGQMNSKLARLVQGIMKTT